MQQRNRFILLVLANSSTVATSFHPILSSQKHPFIYMLGGSVSKVRRNLRLPLVLGFPVDLGRGLEAERALDVEQAGAGDELVAQHGLVVVGVGRAVGAVAAMEGLA